MPRDSIDAHMKFSAVLDGEETSVFRKMLNVASPFAKWCMRTMSEFVYKWLQFHILLDIDDEVRYFCASQKTSDLSEL